MIPIALAIISSVNEATNTSIGKTDETTTECIELHQLPGNQRGFCKALVLACAHGSLIGGTAIITSTGPNLVFRELIQTKYAENEISVSYVQWMAFAMPGMVLCLLASYVVLMCSFMGPRHLYLWCSPPADDERHISQAVGKRVKAAYDSLGDFT
ncbi:hypothetical protein ANCCAN_17364 [Ancylostoma caninum]|uniref:Uncharacterized protein n=1 Tax=Ancylostoma caninum TaxID=29170 RepID=A0A368G2E8_ANCCA|nr:hypothetical protein ANCCAN_17364 [Ancylostoma caninum]